MGTPETSPRGWNLPTRVVFRFVFAYFIFYSLPVVLGFPNGLLMLASGRSGMRPSVQPPSQAFITTAKYLAYPIQGYTWTMARVTPWVCKTFLNVETAPPTTMSGSGDRQYNYCTAFADLVLAIAVTLVWTTGSELWWRLRTGTPPRYDRLHTLLRAVIRFHLMYQMVVYGSMKVWCNQFPPISDFQLETKYGDSSPMGLLWRFMQYSQPYTSFTGIVEYVCGVLLITRRTTLLGALFTAAATLQVFMLNMCYDVPVKLMSGHLLLMSLVLIAPDAPRLFRFLVLSKPVEPRVPAPLCGDWRRLNMLAVGLRTVTWSAFAILMLHQFYKEAITSGIWAPEDPSRGRWVGQEFVRNGEVVPFPPQPDNPPPRPVNMKPWQDGQTLPPVIRFVNVNSFVTLMYEDGSGSNFRNLSEKPSEFKLIRLNDGRTVATLHATFPEPDLMMVEGDFDGQQVRMTLKRIPEFKRDYYLRSRPFQWIQDRPMNR